MAASAEKVCTTCGEPWPADVGFFRALVKSPDTLASVWMQRPAAMASTA